MDARRRLLNRANLFKSIQSTLGLFPFERIPVDMRLLRWQNNFSASNFEQSVPFCVEVPTLYLSLYFPIAMNNGLCPAAPLDSLTAEYTL